MRVISFLKNHSRAIVFLTLIVNSQSAVSQDNIEQFLRETTVKMFVEDCNSLIDMIRVDSRLRMSENGSSVEQIYDQQQIKMTSQKIDCKGLALLSDSKRKEIIYGAYKDQKNEIILYYNL